MNLTLDAVRNHAIPTAAPRPCILVDSQASTRARLLNASRLFALPCRSWSLKAASIATIPLRRVTRSACMHTNFKDERDNTPRRSRVVVRCEMTPKGRDSSQGHDEQHQQHCKYSKREHAHSPGGHEEEHHHHPADKKACHKRGEEEAKAGSEWHDVFHSELREWKGMRGSKKEENGEEEEPYPEYTPRHNGGDEGRACSALKESDKGYVIKVSKELMGLFCYIEKRKRSMIKELAHTLRQIAVVALVLTCVRGVFAPLVEVFKTSPPSWSKLLLMLVSLDSVAICYLTIKSAEPLEQLAALATENRQNIMEGVEKEEEMILKIAIEFIRLFKRLRNIAITLTVSQTAQLFLTVLKMKDPEFVGNVVRVVQTWMQSPWT